MNAENLINNEKAVFNFTVDNGIPGDSDSADLGNGTLAITIIADTKGSPFPGNLSNIVLYLEKPNANDSDHTFTAPSDTAHGTVYEYAKDPITDVQNESNDIIKIIFSSSTALSMFHRDADLQTWIDNHTSLLGGHTELEAFTYHVGNNSEQGALGADMRSNEGQLVIVPEGGVGTLPAADRVYPAPPPNTSAHLQNPDVVSLTDLNHTIFDNGAHLHDGYALTF